MTPAVRELPLRSLIGENEGRFTMSDTAHETSGQKEALPLAKAAENLVEECRLILPGLQAIIGFQLIAVFQTTFEQKLSPPEQQLHLLALGLDAVAAAILMTPAAYHRQTGPREVTVGFITVSTRLLMASMPLLALGICADFYLIARLLLGTAPGAILATAVFAAFAGLWFVLPRVRALRCALGDRCQTQAEQHTPAGMHPAPALRPSREAIMTVPLDQLPAWEPDSGRLQVVIDTPRGSRYKYKYDAEHGLWRLSKVLPLGAAFPFDFGFVPSTQGEDGDPLDALVIMDEPAFPGCVVRARLIGVIEAEQTENGKTTRNDRLVAVLDTEHNPATIRSLDELGRQRLDEIEHFFISYNEAEGRSFKPLARRGPERARDAITAALVDQPSRRTRRKTQRRVKKSR